MDSYRHVSHHRHVYYEYDKHHNITGYSVTDVVLITLEVTGGMKTTKTFTPIKILRKCSHLLVYMSNM